MEKNVEKITKKMVRPIIKGDRIIPNMNFNSQLLSGLAIYGGSMAMTVPLSLRHPREAISPNPWSVATSSGGTDKGTG